MMPKHLSGDEPVHEIGYRQVTRQPATSVDANGGATLDIYGFDGCLSGLGSTRGRGSVPTGARPPQLHTVVAHNTKA